MRQTDHSPVPLVRVRQVPEWPGRQTGHSLEPPVPGLPGPGRRMGHWQEPQVPAWPRPVLQASRRQIGRRPQVLQVQPELQVPPELQLVQESSEPESMLVWYLQTNLRPELPGLLARQPELLPVHHQTNR